MDAAAQYLDVLMGCSASEQETLVASSPYPSSPSLSPYMMDMDRVKITGLTSDSRKVEKGFLFAAFKGQDHDGRDYIPSALDRGASAILTDSGVILPAGTNAVHIKDPFPRKRFSILAANFYGFQPPNLVAVTGTNGKTSVVEFARQIWESIGMRAACVGTLGVRYGQLLQGSSLDSKNYHQSSLTTADPVSLHETLAGLARNGVTHAGLEASSHGLDQGRLDGCRIKAAAFTNISRDHLDYHKSESAYLYAKGRLFADLLMDGGTAVICRSGPGCDMPGCDMPGCDMMEGIVKGRQLDLITIGTDSSSSWMISNHKLDHDGQYFSLKIEAESYDVHLPLIGDFQMWNWLTAAALVVATGVDILSVLETAQSVKTVPGRMDLVGVTEKGGSIIIDYAHTPSGLETVLNTARMHTTGRLVVVFGCGGDRDKGKRSLMGSAASSLADTVFITDDNPRYENAEAIRETISKAAPGAVIIPNRADAIAVAARSLASGDLLIVAGKGHETGQIIKGKIHPFDDFLEARKYCLIGHSEKAGGS